MSESGSVVAPFDLLRRPELYGFGPDLAVGTYVVVAAETAGCWGRYVVLHQAP